MLLVYIAACIISTTLRSPATQLQTAVFSARGAAITSIASASQRGVAPLNWRCSRRPAPRAATGAGAPPGQSGAEGGRGRRLVRGVAQSRRGPVRCVGRAARRAEVCLGRAGCVARRMGGMVVSSGYPSASEQGAGCLLAAAATGTLHEHVVGLVTELTAELSSLP